MHVWHSGGRGYHIAIPPLVLGHEAGHPQLPRIYAAMIDQLFPATVAPSLDRSIYSMRRGRMWRLPNRRRSDSDRYKVPLSIHEALHKPYVDLETLTRRPHHGLYWPADEELSPCQALLDLYRATVARLQDALPPSPARHGGARIPEGQRNATLASLAGSMRRRGASAEAIEAALMTENRQRCDPPLPDEEIGRIAASIARYTPEAGEYHPSVNGDGAHDTWAVRWLQRQQSYDRRLRLPAREMSSDGD